jgi:hypothetical protein
MQAIEFTTASQNGIIKIPQGYKDWLSKSVRVILLSDAEGEISRQEADQTELRRFFDQFTADLTGYRFDREEANAR